MGVKREQEVFLPCQRMVAGQAIQMEALESAICPSSDGTSAGQHEDL